MPSSSPIQLEIVSDVVCPWCYIGKHRLERGLALLKSEHKFDIRWRPYELNPTLPAEGMDRRDYCKAKFGSLEYADQLYANVAANAEADGLPMDVAAIKRTPNTRAAHRLIEAAGECGRQDALVDALFKAYFVDGKDVGNHETLEKLALEAGLDQQTATDTLQNSSRDVEIEAYEGAVKEQGIHGVPAFLFNGRMLFSGAQSAETISLSLQRAIDRGL